MVTKGDPMNTLALLRHKKGFTQEALAKTVGLSRQDLNRLENGWLMKVRPDVESRLRRVFGAQWTLEALLQDVEIKPPGGA